VAATLAVDSWPELAIGEGQAKIRTVRMIKITKMGHLNLILVNLDFRSELILGREGRLYDDLGLFSFLLNDTGFFDFSVFNFFFNPTTPMKRQMLGELNAVLP
jgi:hypothetical protein